MMGQAFGMWNLVAEVGAVLSPVLCGWLRDTTGDWGAAIGLTSLLMVLSAALVLLVPRTVR
jgi:MFS-type transporter involved in bile tolerance (Atg22 family)